MNQTIKEYNSTIKEYGSIGEFEHYINTTPLNDIFRWKTLSSSSTGAGFAGTETYEQAVDLLKHGWDDGSIKIEKALKLIAKDVQPMKAKIQTYDVVGFQASVPRYLQGVPTNMINHKVIAKQQKVITIVKNINYMGNVSPDQIIAESIKAIQLVKKIEAMNYRINLDIISVSNTFKELHSIRIRIKSANERVNVSKLAFPLVHPSMLRRFEFRHIEVCQELKDSQWAPSYGRVSTDTITKSVLKPNDVYLPNFIHNIDETIKNLQLD